MVGYDAVVFDNDGVLVEPPERPDQVAAVEAAFEAVGVPDPPRDHVRALTGGVTPDRLRAIAAAAGVEPTTLWDARERHDERQQLERFRAGDRERYEDVAVVPGLTAARAVVSNNHQTTVDFVLDHFDMAPWFDVHYGRPMTVESLRHKKPNTHYVDRALAELDASDALFVGDSESDLLAAHRAGIDAVFVRRDHARAADLAVEPTFDVDSLRALPAIVDGG